MNLGFVWGLVIGALVWHLWINYQAKMGGAQ